MYSSNANMMTALGDFKIDGMMMRYSNFMPRLYNLCKSLGFESGKIMPSRAFCSDENQGYPIILLAKHFGAFPFNHGMVGGIVATDRHGPHATHGKDLVIIQASHVGYDPESKSFGIYKRMQTENEELAADCGKVSDVLSWYLNEYKFCQDNIFLQRTGSEYSVFIDNQLLRDDRENGIFLNLEKMIEADEAGNFVPVHSQSTSKCFRASKYFVQLIGKESWETNNLHPIGQKLLAQLFRFKKELPEDLEGRNHLEQNLLDPMSWIVTSPTPLLTAAKANTQVEFDRTFRTIVREDSYRDKRILFISGLNIDISPQEGQIFPLTKFIPWAAFIQQGDGTHYLMEQDELMQQLLRQSENNPDQLNLEDAIQKMRDAQEIVIKL